MRGAVLLPLFAGLVDCACPDASWRENPATGKCYKIVPGYVAHGRCASSCGASASLACIQDTADEQYVQDWMTNEGIPGTPRKVVWIGNLFMVY